MSPPPIKSWQLGGLDRALVPVQQPPDSLVDLEEGILGLSTLNSNIEAKGGWKCSQELGCQESTGPTTGVHFLLSSKYSLLHPRDAVLVLGKEHPEAQSQGPYQWGRNSWGPLRAEVRQEVQRSEEVSVLVGRVVAPTSPRAPFIARGGGPGAEARPGPCTPPGSSTPPRSLHAALTLALRPTEAVGGPQRRRLG